LLGAQCLNLSTVYADFVILKGTSVIERNRLRTDAQLELSLDNAPSDALRAGIPLTLAIEMQLMKQNNFLLKQVISSWQYQYILDYHPLSGRYLINDLASNQMKSYSTLIEALNSLSRFRSSEKLKNLEQDNNRLIARLRAVLKTNALPQPLRLMTFFFPEWQQTSEWRQWDIIQ